MKAISHRLDTHGEPLEILPLADIHVGESQCDIKLVSDLIQSVKERPNRYCILDGDLMNTAIVGSKSDIYSETMTPQAQLDRCIELFEPIKDKILAIVTGNHEERISKATGVNMTRVLAQQLGLAQIYSSTSCVVFVHFGRGIRQRPLAYTIYVNHGSGGGGRRPGGKVNRLADYAGVVTADVYIVGHTHFPATFKQATFTPNTGNDTLTRKEQLFVNTASALTYGGYGDRGGYTPNSNSYPVITLDPHRIRATVTL